MSLTWREAMWMSYFLAIGCIGFAGGDNPAIRDIDDRRQIFVDTYIIDKLDGTFLQMHEPVDKGMALKFGDSPCEDRAANYVTILKDDNVYHMYYRGVNSEQGQEGTYCYARSEDGMNWIKPKLGICEFKGSRDNNVILVGADGTHAFSPFIDFNPKAKREERFKALGLARTPDKHWVLLAFVSPDGVHWQTVQNEPVLTKGAFDSQNVPFWSESEGRYVCYYRTWNKDRRVTRATSEDFIHWSEGELMEYRCCGQEAPLEQLYINQTFPYFRAPDVYIATAARFMEGRRAITAKQVESEEFKALGKPRINDCSDAVLLSTRGGSIYERTFMEAWIRPGIGLENWTTRTNYPALNIVQTGPTEMSTYLVEGYEQTTARLERYAMRLDGFISVCAPYKGGEFITRLFRLEGSALEINYSTSAAGSIKVEIQNDRDEPIEGYNIEASDEIIGDEIRRLVSWKNNTLLDKLKGKAIRLRFVMKDADLYSFKLESGPGGRSPQVKEFRIGQRRLFYTDDGRGPAVVLMHGAYIAEHQWDQQIIALTAAGYRVICPYRAGCGGSDVAETMSIAADGDDALALLDSLEVDKFVVGGHSGGGSTAIQVLLEKPERVTGLMLCDSVYGFSGPVSKMGPDRLVSENTRAAYTRNRDTLVRLDREWVYPSDFTTKKYVEWDEWMRENAAHLVKLKYQPDPRNHPVPQGRYCPVPLLVITAGWGKIQPGDPEAVAMQKSLPAENATFHVITESGHWVQQEQSQEVNRMMLDFLAALNQYPPGK